MIVNYKTALPRLKQDLKDITVRTSFDDVHNGLQALQTSVQSLVLNSEIATGLANGTNRKFTLKNIPSMISVNGVVQVKTSYSFINNVLTFKTAPAASAIIESYYL